MSAPIPCLRHTERKWLAYCDDCTAWHLARQIAARDAAARTTTAVDITARVSATPRLTVVPAAARSAVPALTAAA
ncbi:hypothetical protein [Geodermatophilus sp. CPCC 206100]|uniref:hypothetical protein n=1 Tax=Geodermatophilus sp. CPCC 206100 TaxID=3020054 RepID=UPI003AFFF5AB